MTFELSPEQQALQAAARTFAAEHIAPAAGAVDRDGVIPQALLAAVEQSGLVTAKASATHAIVAIEEWATASAAVSAAAGLAYGVESAAGAASAGADAQLPGLRGLGAIDTLLRSLAPAGVARVRIVLAAVAVGIGRAALDEALSAMRASGDRPNGEAGERPHWVLADAATEVEAARLLTQKAAQALDKGDDHAEASLAKVFAADVAQRAVEAALRILGPAGYRRGTVSERLTRDAQTMALLGGTGEEQRAIVADATLPV